MYQHICNLMELFIIVLGYLLCIFWLLIIKSAETLSSDIYTLYLFLLFTIGYYFNDSFKQLRQWYTLLSCFRFLLFTHQVVLNSLWPHGLQPTRRPCPSLSPGVCSNSCPSSWWCPPTISYSVAPFSSWLQSFTSSVSFSVSQFFASGGQCIGASASVLPMNIQGWFSLGLTGLISLQSKGLVHYHNSKTIMVQLSYLYMTTCVHLYMTVMLKFIELYPK